VAEIERSARPSGVTCRGGQAALAVQLDEAILEAKRSASDLRVVGRWRRGQKPAAGSGEALRRLRAEFEALTPYYFHEETANGSLTALLILGGANASARASSLTTAASTRPARRANRAMKP
jgi:hypothetical protein